MLHAWEVAVLPTPARAGPEDLDTDPGICRGGGGAVILRHCERSAVSDAIVLVPNPITPSAAPVINSVDQATELLSVVPVP